MSEIPTSNNLSGILKSTVETNTSTIKTIVKGQALYAASLIAIPLYFRAVSKLYGGYAKFALTNLLNAAKIAVAGKLINKSLDDMIEMHAKIGVIMSSFQKPKVYLKAKKSVTAMMELMNCIVDSLTGDISLTRNLFNGKKRTIVTLKQMLKASINVTIYMLVLKVFAKMVGRVNGIIDQLLKIKRRRAKRALKGIERMKVVLTSLTEFFNGELIQGIKIGQQLKTTLKLVALGTSIVVLTTTLALVGMFAGPAVIGAVALRLIIAALSGIFNKGGKYDDQKSKNVIKSMKAFRLVLNVFALLVATIVARKILENLNTIANTLDAKQAAIGMLVIASISLGTILLMYAIQFLSTKLKSNKIKVVIDMIVAFITAWAAAKIAETIAPIGQLAKDVFLGMAVIAGVTIGMIILMYLVQVLSSKLKSNKIKVVIDMIAGFITAWAAAKIAETVAPLAGMAAEIFMGVAIICGVILMFVTTMWLVNVMLKKAKLVRIAIGLVAISIATLITFTTLAMAMIFAPFALITMTALLGVAIISALIGVIWKPIIKGAIAMAALGIALSILASPILIFGITGAILAAACGSSKEVLVVIGSLVMAVFLFGMMAALFGTMAEAIIIGCTVLGALGLALLSIALPLLVFSVALEKLQNINIDEDSFASIVRMLANGVTEIFNHFAVLNPISLLFATTSMLMLVPIVACIGSMADTLQHIASLNIPIEFDNKGKPIKFRSMDSGDFETAAMNAGSIISFFAAVFSDKDTTLPNGVTVRGVLGDLEGVKYRHVWKMRHLRKMVKSIGKMADTLQHIASLNIPIEFDKNGKAIKYRSMNSADFESAAMNAGSIITFFAAVFSNDDTELPNGVKIHGVLGNLEGISWGVKMKVRFIRQMVENVGDMATVLQQISSLSIPIELTDDGKPKKTRLMTGQDFTNAAMNVSGILGFFTSLWGDSPTEIAFSDTKVTVNPLTLDALDKISIGMKWKIDRLGSIVETVGGMAETLQKMSSLVVPDPDGGFNENGTAKKWRMMSGQDIVAAAMNAGSLLNFFCRLFSENDQETAQLYVDGAYIEVSFQTLPLHVLENITRGLRRRIERLGDIVSVVGGMAQTLQKMSSLTVPDPDGGFNENGTAKKWRMMTAEDMYNAAAISGTLLQFFCALFGEQPVSLSLGSMGVVTVTPISEDALDNIGRSTKKKMEAIGATVSAVGGMAETLQKLGAMIIPDIQDPTTDINPNGTAKKWRKMTDADFTNAMKSVERILTSVINIIGDEEMQDKLSDMSKRSSEKLANVMGAMGGLTSVLELIKSMAGGRIAIEWTYDNDPKSPTYGTEKPTKFINIVDYLNKNKVKIETTIEKMLMCPINAISTITDDSDKMKNVKKASNSSSIIAKTINAITSPIKQLMELYTENLSKVNIDDYSNKMTNVITYSIEPLASFEMNKMVEIQRGSLVVFERIVGTICGDKSKKGISALTPENAKNLQLNIKETTALIKQVGSVDVNKLKYTADLMKRISELSTSIRGNFKELSKAISEDLLQAIEKLNESLNKINTEGISSTSSHISETMEQSGTPGVARTIKGIADKSQPDKSNKPTVSQSDFKTIKDDIAAIKNALDSVINNGQVRVDRG